MACRKLTDKFEDIQLIDKVSTNAQLEALSTSVTKMQYPKRGTKRYFHADLTDGAKKIKVVGFDEEQQKQLEEFKLQKSPVKLTNCIVQKSTYTGNYEIKLTGQTKLELFPTKKIQLPDSGSSGEVTPIVNVQKMANMDTAENIKIKVVKVNSPHSVSSGKKKQDIIVTVADGTGCIKLTLWQDEVGKFVTGHSYKLDQVGVCIYNEMTYISFPKGGAKYEEISDIGEIQSEPINFGPSNEFANAYVSGVSHIFKYTACMKCKSKVEETNNSYGRCRSCNMLQNLDQAHNTFSATLMVTLPGKEEPIETQAFKRELRKVAEIVDDDITDINLLDAQPFSFQMNTRNVLTNVWR